MDYRSWFVTCLTRNTGSLVTALLRSAVLLYTGVVLALSLAEVYGSSSFVLIMYTHT
ncbi:hypothetical protein DAEQUDRAFT_729245 [Daedalea quercina L-15889]|uniref:Uncharacterized protein n=1 Tax=Daedalea quercina L-15889 TaxID=1314783 RepID=A0A165NPM4_9APHY|nr:hypothetical protein DAEQUDRAFT_729245 [Daedalea quercina L-15889]